MEQLDPYWIEPGPEGSTMRTIGGEAKWSTSGGTAAGGYREVLMASGVTPPEPLISTDDTDWLYGEA